MPKLLNQKVGQITITDALLIAGTKQIEERLLSGFVGNGTLFSGMIKGGLGIVMNSALGGKTGDIIGTAFIVDGAEDIVNYFIPASSLTSLRTGSNGNGRRVL